jgi:hypothetical protein
MMTPGHTALTVTRRDLHRERPRQALMPKLEAVGRGVGRRFPAMEEDR